jgi:hypothetical protein
MRTDQYIGLTNDAKAFVSKATSVETYEIEGAWNSITLSVYHMPPPEGPNKELICREVVQASPWSGGPMYFTCLEATLVKENGSTCEMSKLFEWVVNPMLPRGQEFDEVKGHYYV